MAMSKKDFIELADAMRDMHADIQRDATTPQIKAGRFDQWQRTLNTMADFCKRQNSAFMRDRWLDYIAGKCGKNGGKVAA